jgi:hypothetical protein
LRDVAPEGWRATLCAVDGATVDELDRQLRCLPADASHLVISIGGNDVLSHIDLLSMGAASMIHALEELARRVDPFAMHYRAAIANVLRFQKRTIVCTIYEGRLESAVQRPARTALSLFNDAIARTANDLRIPIIELRSICTAASDYANPIEPSGSGGRKIAIAIRDAIERFPA